MTECGYGAGPGAGCLSSHTRQGRAAFASQIFVLSLASSPALMRYLCLAFLQFLIKRSAKISDQKKCKNSLTLSSKTDIIIFVANDAMRDHGELAEWSKAHDWKSCYG